MSSDVLGHRYCAFISYRDADNREEGRRWADWLQHLLVTYAVPADLVGKPNNRGELMPARLSPVFCDAQKGHTDGDLPIPFREALDNSAALIVICSPRAVEASSVSEEICHFKESGKANRVLALIIDGEPNADDPGKRAAGLDPAAESFPAALRFGVPNVDGVMDWSQRAEPLAADVRPGSRPEQGWTTASLYGAALRKAALPGQHFSRRLQREYRDRLHLAGLKLIAGVLGINLGRLTRRDEEHRARKLYRVACIFGLLGGSVLVAGAVALWQRGLAAQRGAEVEIAKIKSREAQLLASLRDYGTAQTSFSKGEWRRGLAYLAHSLKLAPQNPAAAFAFWQQVVYGHGDRDCLPLLTLAHADSVSTAVFSPDGTAVLTACTDKSARIFDSRTGQLIRQLEQSGAVLSAVFSRDGSQVLTAAKDRTVRVWDTRSGAALGEPFHCEANPKHAIFSPAGDRILVANATSWTLVDRQTTKVIVTHPVSHFPGFNPGGARIVFSPDGALFAAVEWVQANPGGMSGPQDVVVLYDSKSGLPVGTATLHVDPLAESWGPISNVVFSRAGRYLLILHPRMVTLFELSLKKNSGVDETGGSIDLNYYGKLQPESAVMNSAVYSPDARQVLTACADGAALLWWCDVGTQAQVRLPSAASPGGMQVQLRLPHPASLSNAVFSPDGGRFLTVSDDQIVRVWSAMTGGQIARFEHPKKVRSAIFSPDGSRVLTVAEDQAVRVWETAGEPFGELQPGHVSSPGPERNPSGEQYLTVEDSTVRLWDKKTEQPLGVALIHRRPVKAAGFSSDGTSVLTLNDSGAGRLWAILQPQPPAPEQITQAATVFSGLRFTDHDILESVSMDERIRLAAPWRTLPAEHSPWDALWRWALRREPDQPLTPFSKSTRRQVADALISIGLSTELDEARMLDPANPKLPALAREDLPAKARPANPFMTATEPEPPTGRAPDSKTEANTEKAAPSPVDGGNSGAVRKWKALTIGENNINDWRVSGPGSVTNSGGVLTLTSNGGLAGIVSQLGAYSPQTLHGMRFELAASEGTTAWVAPLVEESNGNWQGYTSEIDATDSTTMAGGAGCNFEAEASSKGPMPAGELLERVSFPQGQFFRIEFEMHADGSLWTTINDYKTSCLLRTAVPRAGHVGLFVKSGSLKIRKIEFRD
jgi:WD40 repeat protein